MELINNWDRPPSGVLPRTVFTIGVFDGLHLGHQALIGLVLENAARFKAQSLVLTFDPHPLEVLAKSASPPLLTTVAQKAEILAAWGLDRLGVLKFNREMAATEPVKFLNQYVGRFIEPAGVVLGPDFAFGQDAGGDAETVRAWLGDLNPKARLIRAEAVSSGGGTLASSKIRQDIKEGLVGNAAQDLGRCYRLAGTVVHGQARGRTLGFPTANLGRIRQLIPGPGVYAVRVLLAGQTYSGMTAIGHNPTFGEKSLTVETNILDFDSCIYGQDLALDFVARLRPMLRFDSIASLVQQMRQDRVKAKQLLTSGRP